MDPYKVLMITSTGILSLVILNTSGHGANFAPRTEQKCTYVDNWMEQNKIPQCHVLKHKQWLLCTTDSSNHMCRKRLLSAYSKT